MDKDDTIVPRWTVLNVPQQRKGDIIKIDVRYAVRVWSLLW